MKKLFILSSFLLATAGFANALNGKTFCRFIKLERDYISGRKAGTYQHCVAFEEAGGLFSVAEGTMIDNMPTFSGEAPQKTDYSLEGNDIEIHLEPKPVGGIILNSIVIDRPYSYNAATESLIDNHKKDLPQLKRVK